MPVILPATEDSAQSTLSSGINASVLTIAVADGSVFPQPYTGSATSGGTNVTLNSTGIGSSGVAVDDIIRNVTDGSWAKILTVSANSVTTTRLQGGTDNLWDNSDVWRVNEFFITIDNGDANGETVTAREKILISNRSTNNLTVPTGGRGYDGSTAQTWTMGQYVRLNVVSLIPENLIDAIGDMAEWNNTNQTNIATNGTDIDNIESNATFYVAAGSSNAFTGTLSSMPAAYTTGERLYFKANHDITGSASFNRAGLGAKTIKKVTTAGKTNLEAGDIQDTGIYEIVYDGTDYVLQNPVANAASADLTRTSSIDQSTNMDGASWTTGESYTFIANSLAVGDVVEITAVTTSNGGTRDLRILVGATGTATFTSAPNTGAGLLKFYLTVRTSTTGWWAGSYTGATSVANSNASSELTIDTTSTLAFAVQGQQTGGAETEHFVQQFVVVHHKAQATQ